MRKSALFILGNPNEFTFANAILAAHEKAGQTGAPLSKVFAIHTPKSADALVTSTRWKEHLRQHGMNPELIHSFTCDLENDSAALDVFANHIELILKGLGQRYEVYVDLTNGTSLYKNVLSNVAFILGVRRLFTLDIAKLPAKEAAKLPGAPPKSVGFASPEDLNAAYVALPDPAELDRLAPAWLTEITRYRALVERMKEILTTVRGVATSEVDDFGREAILAVEMMLEGECDRNLVKLTASLQATGKAFEILTNLLFTVLGLGSSRSRKLHEKIEAIRGRLRMNRLDSDDLYSELATSLRVARNNAAHPADRVVPLHVEAIRARTNLGLLHRLLDCLAALNSTRRLSSLAGSTVGLPSALETVTSIAAPALGQRYYFGLDGDDTGRKLEGLFANDVPEQEFTEFSERIQSVIKRLEKLAKAPPISGRVLFCAGDDMLFVGAYHQDTLEQMKKTYADLSGGYTCSIGFGRSAREAYIALKMAKARPGKDSIVGIQLVSEEKTPVS